LNVDRLHFDRWLHLFGWFDHWPLTECGRSCDYRIYGSDTPLSRTATDDRNASRLYIMWGQMVLGPDVLGTRSPRTSCPGGHFYGGTSCPVIMVSLVELLLNWRWNPGVW